MIEYNEIQLLIIAIYMPCDRYTQVDDEYEYVLSVIESIRLEFNPDYVIYGGDLARSSTF